MERSDKKFFLVFLAVVVLSVILLLGYSSPKHEPIGEVSSPSDEPTPVSSPSPTKSVGKWSQEEMERLEEDYSRFFDFHQRVKDARERN